MNNFEIYDYRKQCPTASAVEDVVNNSNSHEKQLDAISGILGYKDRMMSFFIACILCWADARYYDERNRWTVLVCRRIAESFPKLKETPVCEEIRQEAYGFTTFAHRYLQSSLFKVILHCFKKTGDYGIHEWYEQQQLVIDNITEQAIPYEEYKKRRF